MLKRKEILSKKGSGIPKEPPSYEDSEAEKTRVPFQRTRTSELIRPTLIRRGSASTTSLQLAQTNVPYRPLKEIQAHIDLLTGSSSKTLTTFSTATKTEYFDLLPSFQMFQSILKRNDFEFDENRLGQPPKYGDTQTSSPSPPGGLTPTTSLRDNDDVLRSVSGRLAEYENEYDSSDDNEGRYLFSDDDEEDGRQTATRMRPQASSNSQSNAHQPLGVVNHESYGHSVVDNIDRLPHARSSPLTIEIFVTKGVPIPNTKNPLETKLKEYSSGDIVNGYVIISNTLDEDVDFGLFTVSLECTVKAIYQEGEPSLNRRCHRILLKKLLKMYDLNASYNYGVIPSSAGVEYGPYEIDALDDTIMGLPDNRVLKANLRYKKFITFKFPEMLLDNACPHNVLRHTMPPPSFGIDSTAFSERASQISVNKALGYGFLNVHGSPVKVRDYAFDDISVSYAIEAKFIDKQHAADQQTPVNTNDINDPENESKYIISKSSQFFLRFVPDIKSQVDTDSRAYNTFRHDTFDNIGIDGMLFGNLVKCPTWKFIKFMNSTLEQEIRNALDRSELNGDDIKRKNLLNDNENDNDNDDSNGHNLMRPTSSNIRENDREREQRQFYMDRKMIGTFEPVEILGKKKKRLLLSTIKIGEASLYAQVPDKLIAYGSPRLIQKYNDSGNKSTDKESLSDVFSRLHPVGSNMGDLYNRDDSTVLQHVKLELVFDNYEEAVHPPAIALIEYNIVAWSYRTDYPIPVSFDHDFFYTKPNDKEWKIYADDVENTKVNLQDLKQLVNEYINFLKETKTYISQNTYSYLKGLSKLGVKKDTIKEYFQTQTASSHALLLNDSNWSVNQLDNRRFRWTKELVAPLKVVNKNNITLPPSFQSCLVGRVYCLQIVVKLKGADDPANILRIDVPILVG